jgi:hypothetical protein
VNRAKKAALLLIPLLPVASFCWLITRGNAVWRVHHHYPTATVSFAPVNSPDPARSDLVRLLGFRFYSGQDRIGIDLSDATVDLNDFRGMSITYMTFTRCRLSDIRPVLSEYHPLVIFDDCDLSAVPPDQLRFLYSTDDAPKVRSIGNLYPRSYPGVKGLHEYSLFP